MLPRALALAIVGLLVVVAVPAEAKRLRLLPGTKPAPAAVATPAKAPVQPAAATRSSQPGVVFFSTGGGAAAAQEAEKRRDMPANRAWASTAPSEPAPVVAKPAVLPNPDARDVPVMGSAVSDQRPVKGFSSLN